MTRLIPWRPLGVLLGLAISLGLTGCAAVTNPVVDGIPVRRLPPEVLGESKDLEQPIALTALRQKSPEVYRLAPGDVLGVWVEGVLGDRNQPPPVRIPEQGNVPPALGFPLPVRENGTVPLPLINPVKVEGLTVEEAQAKIIEAYTVKKQILQPGRERVIVTLVRPRQYHVLVLREDSGAVTFGSSGGFNPGLVGGGTFISETRRTAGFSLDLPAYENDVLNALTRTGGLPGYDAENEVVIERGAYRDPTALPAPDKCSAEELLQRVQGRGEQALRIPLRLRPGETLDVRPEDVILRTGDVVVVKARRGDVFYTGGLLPARAFPLPRDRDLDIIQALALVGAPLVNGGFNANNLTGTLVQTGLGFPSPSLVTVLRKTKSGSQLPIRVSVNRALRDPRERILVQPGDVIILQQQIDEALAQYLTTNLRFNFLGFFIRERDLTGTGSATLP